MREIQLVNGRGIAFVDDEDYEMLARFRWLFNNGYALARIDGCRIKVSMHRLLMAPPADMLVDHRNHNGLDNRRDNLRICTRSQNSGNWKGRSRSRSGYRGVSPRRDGGFVAILARRYLGIYRDPILAAQAYDAAAVQHFGEFAQLNFPDVLRAG